MTDEPNWMTVPYEDGNTLMQVASRMWTRENLGADISKPPFYLDDLYEEDTRKIVDEEWQSQYRVAQAAYKALKARGLEPTLKTMEGLSREAKISREYSRR